MAQSVCLSGNADVVRLPTAARKSFRFTGKIGEIDLTNLYPLNLPPRLATREIEEAREHIKQIGTRLDYMTRYAGRDNDIRRRVLRGHLDWWKRELSTLEKRRDAAFKRRFDVAGSN